MTAAVLNLQFAAVEQLLVGNQITVPIEGTDVQVTLQVDAEVAKFYRDMMFAQMPVSAPMQ